LGGPRIVLVGGPDEIDRMDDLRKRGGLLPEADNAAGAAATDSTPESGQGMPRAPERQELVAPLFGLSDLARLLQGAAYYIGCDTGVMHLAAAVGTPTIALFFRSNPLHYAPLGTGHYTVLLADPYGANDGDWEVAVSGVERSRLLVVPTEPEGSGRGIPVTGPLADSAILAAVGEILEGESARADDVRPDSLRTSPS
jgi:ADP-heptose:LPS heptosyltransferase